MIKGEILKEKLKAIDGKDYGGYQALKGDYDFSTYSLKIHQIPKDPYAPPHTGIYCIRVNRSEQHIINRTLRSRIQEIAFKDFLARRFYQSSFEISKDMRGTGFSGVITIDRPGQVILDRNSINVDDKSIEVRCFLGLPASGRNINASIAETMLFQELPEIIERSLFIDHLEQDQLDLHLQAAEDAEYLRNQLEPSGLVAFIADGSILPRKSGTSDQSMSPDSAVPFVSPPGLKLEMDLPHRGRISGMGIPQGVTLIVGGGYHGKSTLLKALEVGCYNHIPSDGRELCVSLPESVKARAYSGRSIAKTDISPFIRNLPFQKNTTEFSSENSSGSTSQAASIIEALEVGTKVLLMDEDTCATNFMIRDSKMQQLVRKVDEPITTFIDSVKQLYIEKKVSTVLVLGGIGDYFDVSDQVIQLIDYKPMDVTQKAKEISQKSPLKRISEAENILFQIRERIPLAESVNPHNKYGKKAIFAKEVYRLNFGEQTIDLLDLEQLIELSQTKALGYALDYALKYMDQRMSVKEIANQVIIDIKTQGLDILSDRISGHFAEFRPFELAFTLNRLRGFKVMQKNC